MSSTRAARFLDLPACVWVRLNAFTSLYAAVAVTIVLLLLILDPRVPVNEHPEAPPEGTSSCHGSQTPPPGPSFSA